MAENINRVVVIGGGYAGVLAANRLQRPGLNVTLINPRPRFVERIRLHQLVAGNHAATAITPMSWARMCDWWTPPPSGSTAGPAGPAGLGRGRLRLPDLRGRQHRRHCRRAPGCRPNLPSAGGIGQAGRLRAGWPRTHAGRRPWWWSAAV